MMDLGTLGVTGVSTIVAVAAAAASVISFVRDLYRKFIKGDEFPTAAGKPEKGATVLVQTPDGRSTRVAITIEEANRLLQR